MTIKVNIKIGDVQINLENIFNNLVYINKELPMLNLPDEKDLVQNVVDTFISKLFDLRNILSIVSLHFGIIMIDPLLEEVDDMPLSQAIPQFVEILNEQLTAMCDITEHIGELENEEYPDLQALQVLLHESAGNILLLALKAKANILDTITQFE